MYNALAHKHYFNQTPLYELNYGKLMRYFRGTRGHASHPAPRTHGMTLAVDVREDHKYTSVIDLAVTINAAGTYPINMTMTVRMCHDARVAEVVCCSELPVPEPEYMIPNKFMHHRDEKQQINRLLGEWLDFFSPTSAPVTAASPSAA